MLPRRHLASTVLAAVLVLALGPWSGDNHASPKVNRGSNLRGDERLAARPPAHIRPPHAPVPVPGAPAFPDDPGAGDAGSSGSPDSAGSPGDGSPSTPPPPSSPAPP